MTWYRVGPAGIPGSLKTDMDAVLNKKFGTSTTYAPNTWPDNVNLLGPLPERTEQGTIAHIEDGADAVPIKSWFVTLPASLSGYSSVTATKVGANLLAFIDELDFTNKGIHYYTQNGVLYLDGSTVGETSSKDATFKANLRFFLKKGTYYFDRGTIALPSYIYAVEDDTNAIRTNSGTFTLAEDTLCYLGFYLYNKTFSDTPADTMLNVGTTATSYEAYSAPTTYTASLESTIYGGQADIVTGEGEENCTRIQIKNRTWTIVEVGNYNVFACNKITDKAANFNFEVEGYVNSLNYRNYLQDKQCGTYNITNDMDRIVIRDDSYSTVEDFLTAKGDNYIVYENTNTPDPFTFTPITADTELGTNNFWADEGDSDVTYRADIDLALNA